MARNLVAWCEQLLEHFQDKGDEAEVLDSVGLITKAAAYLADASVDTVRTRARSTALINSDQRAAWMKAWGGRHGLQVQAVCYPDFDAVHLFRPEVEKAICE